MELAGSFRYVPQFELNEASANEILNLEEINEIIDEKEICQSIVDFQFEDTEDQVVYGEIGTSEKTAKFFLHVSMEEKSEVPDEVKVYVPQDQQNYPDSREFWVGHNKKDGERAEMAKQVSTIAENFKTGEVIILSGEEVNNG